MNSEFFRHCDPVYIKDIQRMAVEIKGYKQRVKKVLVQIQKLLLSTLKTAHT